MGKTNIDLNYTLLPRIFFRRRYFFKMPRSRERQSDEEDYVNNNCNKPPSKCPKKIAKARAAKALAKKEEATSKKRAGSKSRSRSRSRSRSCQPGVKKDLPREKGDPRV